LYWFRGAGDDGGGCGAEMNVMIEAVVMQRWRMMEV
jgi:hypothetical protein